MITAIKPHSETLLEELEQECQKFLTAFKKYRSLPENDEQGATYGYVYALLTNLESTAVATRDQIDQELDELPE